MSKLGNRRPYCRGLASQSPPAVPRLSVTCSDAATHTAGRGRKRRKFSAFLTGRDNHPVTRGVD